ncbi:LPS export ABC transporter ATP-binding protein [Hoeflea sp.]|uniref:LPS export ABC transporter ATP-binding protein n=1 Tax=Hoeflea sp. TaxID=1940281 RepID=UPI003BB0CF18
MSASRLEKSFGGINVVKDVSLTIRRGETVAVLGPNGAGKTTLMNIIAGTMQPDAGGIRIDGTDATRMPVFARARLGLSYLPQEPSVFRGLSVEDNIMVALESCYPDRPTRSRILDRILDGFGLTSVRSRNAAKLSGGMRRRCEVARALASNPRYLMLDEPFAGVDPLAVSDLQGLISRIRASGLGILISDHNVRETLSIVDHAYIVVAGKVLAHGTPEEIASNEQVRRFYLGNTLDGATGFSSRSRSN